MIKYNGKEVVFERFPNGELLLKKENIKMFPDVLKMFSDAKWRHFTIEFKWEDDSDLIKLMMLKEYLGKRAFRLVIYYLPYSRMDRSENDSPFTLKYIAKFINSLGFDKVYIVEPHSDVAPALIDNSIVLDATVHLMNQIFELKEHDYVVFPDNGAHKKYQKHFKGVKTLTGYKHRDWETGEIQGLQLMGGMDAPYSPFKRAIIIDDLSSFGGTFYYTALELQKLGFDEIYLVVAHCENSIFGGKLLDLDESPIDIAYTTDSLITKHKEVYPDKLQVFEIEKLLKEMI